MAHSERNRITIWPIDVWAREMEKPKNKQRLELYWTAAMLWDSKLSNGFDIIAFVERDDDRGALIKNSAGAYYLMTPIGTSQSLPQHKVIAALAAANT